MTIRIGTRGSHLALWQAEHLQSLLIEQGSSAELRVIRTTGDKRRDVPLATIGGKGLFIKELEEALERDEIDVAVHSLKDVPSIIPDHFELAGFLERADPRDAWLHPYGATLSELAPGAVVTTDTIAVKAFASQLDGSSAIRTSAEFPATSERSVIDQVFSNLESEGAMEIFSTGSHGR